MWASLHNEEGNQDSLPHDIKIKRIKSPNFPEDILELLINQKKFLNRRTQILFLVFLILLLIEK